LFANAPADETAANRDTRPERNRKRNERRRRLRESLPIRNLAEALDQVESRVHTTPKQCLKSITTIARQAQGMRTGQVIAKLAEDAYFMRVNTRIAQPPPVRNRGNEATSRSADNGRNRTRGELLANPTVLGQQLVDPLMVETALVVTGRSSLTAILEAEAATAGAPTMGLTGELVAVATAAAEATRTATSPAPHVAASTPARKSKNYDARRPPRQATTTASLPSVRDFATYSSQRNSSLWESPSTT
jgi:hypothetical protein